MKMNYKHFKLTKIGDRYSIDSSKIFLGHLEKINNKYVFIPYQHKDSDHNEIFWYQDCVSDLNNILIELNSSEGSKNG